MVAGLGNHLSEIGLKTKILLGDVSHPRGTCEYVRPAVNDPAALQHVGAVSFHTWNGATDEEFASWRKLADSINAPLLVGEFGLDPAAWKTGNFQRWRYALDEAALAMKTFACARPEMIFPWQLTADYSLLAEGVNGELKPTSRFFFLKQMTGLFPEGGGYVDVGDNVESLLTFAVRNIETGSVLHLLNLGDSFLLAVDYGWIPGNVTAHVTSLDRHMSPYDELRRSGPKQVKLRIPSQSLVSLVESAASPFPAATAVD
jgi:hypothetical protein